MKVKLLKVCIMVYAGKLIDLFCVSGLCVSLVYTSNICSPCENGEVSRNAKPSSCNHQVEQRSILEEMEIIVKEIRSMSRSEKRKLNLVIGNVSCTSKCKKPKMKEKTKKKIRFIHETFADLTFAYHMLERIGKILAMDKKGLEDILKGINNTMCHLYQANRSLQCRKNGIMKKRVKSFDKTVKCSKNSVKETCLPSEQKLNGRTSTLKEKRTALLRIEEVIDIFNGTIAFWSKKVINCGKKGNKLTLKQKCKQRKSRRKNPRKSRKSRKRTKKISC